MLASSSRRPGYQQITEKPRFDFLKQVLVLLTCHAVLDVINKRFIVCKHVFRQPGSKMTSFRQVDHGDNDAT